LIDPWRFRRYPALIVEVKESIMATPLQTSRFFPVALAVAALVAWAPPAAPSTFIFGEFVSYDHHVWGADPIPNTPAGLLHDNFSTLYPGVFEIGIPLASGGHFIDFTDQSTILVYLPAVGLPGVLNANVTDPDTTTSGIFGGDVTALKLNIDFSDAGLNAHPSGIAFGDLRVAGLGGGLAGLDGLTVRQILDVANIMLGGGAEPYPLVDFDSLVSQIDSSFDGGFVSTFATDHLELPVVTGSVPEPSTALLMLTSLAGGLGAFARRRRRAG
jgi:hypothetical protein